MKIVAVISPFHRRYEQYCKEHPNQENIEAISPQSQMGRRFDQIVVLAETEEWNSQVARAYEVAMSRRRQTNEIRTM